MTTQTSPTARPALILWDHSAGRPVFSIGPNCYSLNPDGGAEELAKFCRFLQSNAEILTRADTPKSELPKYSAEDLAKTNRYNMPMKALNAKTTASFKATREELIDFLDKIDI